jgi:hypothetical protein
MPPIIVLILVLVIFACAFGYMTYRDAQRQAREKKRNHTTIESKECTAGWIVLDPSHNEQEHVELCALR